MASDNLWEKQEPQSRVRTTAALNFAHNFHYFSKVFASSPIRLGSLVNKYMV